MNNTTSDDVASKFFRGTVLYLEQGQSPTFYVFGRSIGDGFIDAINRETLDDLIELLEKLQRVSRIKTGKM